MWEIFWGAKQETEQNNAGLPGAKKREKILGIIFLSILNRIAERYDGISGELIKWRGEELSKTIYEFDC